MAAAAAPSVDPQLRQNIEDQLERLLSQLEDIEGLKEELSAEEYETMKQVRFSGTHMHAFEQREDVTWHTARCTCRHVLTRAAAGRTH